MMGAGTAAVWYKRGRSEEVEMSEIGEDKVVEEAMGEEDEPDVDEKGLMAGGKLTVSTDTLGFLLTHADASGLEARLGG
jgi:hypothetical protein